ncbi:MAG TPA: biotin/lipoate A/B protein ligase family protein [Thermoanaerobaculia bacterium]
MTVWRYIADDDVTAGFGLAADECLTERVGAAASPSVLRLYTYRSYCALVGRFQNVAAELDRSYCEAAGIAVSRRPTGGGAILMGAQQLGVAIVVPEPRTTSSYEHARDLFTRFSAGVVDALAGLGIEAAYRRKNDLEVRGKKIAGLGIYFHPGGGLLFHTSLLVDLDIPLMLRVLKTPFEKISDKAIATVAERVTTVRRELQREIDVGEVRKRVRDAYAAALGVSLRDDSFSGEEIARIRTLEQEKYDSPSWIDQTPLTPDLAGSAQVKTGAGLLGVSLTLAGTSIKAIYVTGDFFVDEEALATVERALRWSSTEPEAVTRTLRNLQAEGIRLAGIPIEALVEAIRRACEAAADPRGQTARGCFVAPGVEV